MGPSGWAISFNASDFFSATLRLSFQKLKEAGPANQGLGYGGISLWLMENPFPLQLKGI